MKQPSAAVDRNHRRILWILLVALIAYVALAYYRALSLPFLNDDYIILDKVSRIPFPELWAPKALLFNWYRPWSREFHYWILLKTIGLNETAYHVVSFALWLSVLLLYFSLVRRLVASIAAATIATVGLSALALWSAPLLWIAGVQDLWMLAFGLLFLHAVVRGWTLRALLPLCLALLSKETAAVLPLIAIAYLCAVDRKPIGHALRKCWPQWVMLTGWLALHPTLSSRFFGPLQHSMETETRPNAAVTLVKTLLAQFNLDHRLAPEFGWSPILWRAALGAVLLGVALIFGMRARASDSKPRAKDHHERRVLLFGAIWAAAGWVILFLPSIGWHAYYGSFGSLGCWLIVGILLHRHRRLALGLILVLATLREAAATTPSWDWGTYWYQTRAGNLLGVIRNRLFELHPKLPPHSRLYFAYLPNNIGFLAGNGPAVRIWYRDPTLEGRYYSAYLPRTAADAVGGDYFFRFDPAHGLTEIIAGPESTDRDLQRTRTWEQNQLVLSSIFMRAGNLRAAALQYVKLWMTFPRHAEYALFAATLYEAAGDSLEAAKYYRVSDSAMGQESIRRIAPGLVAAARDSVRIARSRPIQ